MSCCDVTQAHVVAIHHHVLKSTTSVSCHVAGRVMREKRRVLRSVLFIWFVLFNDTRQTSRLWKNSVYAQIPLCSYTWR